MYPLDLSVAAGARRAQFLSWAFPTDTEHSDGGADLLCLCLRGCGGRGALQLWPGGGLDGTVSHVEHRARRRT